MHKRQRATIVKPIQLKYKSNIKTENNPPTPSINYLYSLLNENNEDTADNSPGIHFAEAPDNSQMERNQTSTNESDNSESAMQEEDTSIENEEQYYKSSSAENPSIPKNSSSNEISEGEVNMPSRVHEVERAIDITNKEWENSVNIDPTTLNLPGQSDVWGYFEVRVGKSGKRLARCDMCASVFKLQTDSSMSNLRRHITTVHQITLSDQTSPADDETNSTQEQVDETPNKESSPLTKHWNDNEDTVTTRSGRRVKKRHYDDEEDNEKKEGVEPKKKLTMEDLEDDDVADEDFRYSSF